MKTITQITNELKREFNETLGFEPNVYLYESKLVVSFERTIYEKSYHANDFLKNAAKDGFIKSVADFVTMDLL
nr:hypothetical protein [uncultured Pseudogulbenkiania sp.]